MFFIISKILSFLSHPLSWVFVLLIFAWRTRIPRRKKRLVKITIGVLLFFTNSFIVDEFFRMYEERDNTILTEEQHYQTAIVLGGFMTFDPQSNLEGFNESSDRFFHAYRLLKQGKVDRILISGGSGSILRKEEKEAEIMRLFLEKLGEDESEFLFETDSKNTHENAWNTAKLLKEKKLEGTNLLITSGYHMPRSKRCFEKAGVSFIPYSVDHYVGARRYDPYYLLIPTTSALDKWYILIHEWIGFATYWMMGYI